MKRVYNIELILELPDGFDKETFEAASIKVEQLSKSQTIAFSEYLLRQKNLFDAKIASRVVD